MGPSKKSPKVPISSTSATNVSPVAPPNTPAANLFVLDALFNSSAFAAASVTLLDFKFAYVPAFFAFNALSASLVAALKPIPPGIPICVNTSTSLPATLSCAVSSNIFISSKNFSTSPAVLLSAP